MTIKRYEFKVWLCGYGEDDEQAWNDAVDAFAQDPGTYGDFVITDDNCDEWELFGDDTKGRKEVVLDT